MWRASTACSCSAPPCRLSSISSSWGARWPPGAKHAPVIFDVVNNFENLYSISALQEEMETAVQQLYTEGRLSEVVTERFTLIDEVQECRVLFEKLNESLRSGWQQYYEAAKAYAQKHGNLLVPRRFKTEDGLALGEWLSTQRRVYAGWRPAR